jgi:hypothetical protein
MRLEAAIKPGLPAVFTERLKGETPEELEKDAQAIIEALPKVKPGSNVNPTNPNARGGSGETDEQRRKRLFG